MISRLSFTLVVLSFLSCASLLRAQTSAEKSSAEKSSAEKSIAEKTPATSLRVDPRELERKSLAVAPLLQQAVVGIVHSEKDIEPNGIGFGGSGAIVSADGLVLTVAHVIEGTENDRVLCLLNDGRRVTADVVGYFGRGDLALIRLNEKGPWPFLELSQASSFPPGTFCLGAGHTGRIDRERPPPVRIGRILAERRSESFVDESGTSAELGRVFVTDAPFLPGDSGGPLIDLSGKLIGLHTSIGGDHRDNMHIPITAIRKKWPRLLAGEKRGLAQAIEPTQMEALYPEQGTKVYIADFRAIADRSWGRSHMNFLRRFADTVAPAARFTAEIMNEDRRLCFGLVVSAEGEIVTKLTDLGEGKIICRIEGRDYVAKLTARDEANDLALLKIEATGLTPLALPAKPVPDLPLGTWIISADAQGRPFTLGTLGVKCRDVMPPKPSDEPRGFLGVELHPTQRSAKIAKIVPDSAAQRGALQSGDLILALDERPIARSEELYEELRGSKPGRNVTFEIERDGKKHHVKIELGAAPADDLSDALEFAPWSKSSGGISKRSTDFRGVATHDGFVPANSCGSPAFNLAGEFLGLNLARADRTATYLLPAADFAAALDRLRRTAGNR